MWSDVISKSVESSGRIVAKFRNYENWKIGKNWKILEGKGSELNWIDSSYKLYKYNYVKSEIRSHGICGNELGLNTFNRSINGNRSSVKYSLASLKTDKIR